MNTQIGNVSSFPRRFAVATAFSAALLTCFGARGQAPRARAATPAATVSKKKAAPKTFDDAGWIHEAHVGAYLATASDDDSHGVTVTYNFGYQLKLGLGIVCHTMLGYQFDYEEWIMSGYDKDGEATPSYGNISAGLRWAHQARRVRIWALGTFGMSVHVIRGVGAAVSGFGGLGLRLTSAESAGQLWLDLATGVDVNFFDEGLHAPLHVALGISATF